jgi:hypothetical protein
MDGETLRGATSQNVSLKVTRTELRSSGQH